MIEALISGVIIGLILAIIGGGGSILAVPLLVYFVKLQPAHLAIGTSAFVVTVSALAGLILNLKSKQIRWKCGMVFSLFGIGGAWVGSYFGMMVDGKRLIQYFAFIMLIVGIVTFFKKTSLEMSSVELTKDNFAKIMPKLIFSGSLVGFVAGFFGIGGGFLIAPSLMSSTSMSFIMASGTSLLVIFLFGLTTSVNYAVHNLLDWNVALWMIVGGAMGQVLGLKIKPLLKQGLLQKVFAIIVIIIALIMLGRAFFH